MQPRGLALVGRAVADLEGDDRLHASHGKLIESNFEPPTHPIARAFFGPLDSRPATPSMEETILSLNPVVRR